ncbi:hypothetical protein [Streptomyces sporangiiformans]|uniref:Regulatory protein n=1 Tax=Streptomyces sporangiiformans TaxID=2315329 RepID=A0A505DEM4_9ACTN|nr:hypothetical protein [Streptomyces sporangiiformans]TPQ19068.1 hypothetical protein FGD71_027810 [Streptomyces sporangiiformans]
MPDSTIPATELTSQYVAQVASDLERNAKEQERLSAEITALQEQLLALQHDHTVLLTMQQALGGAAGAPTQPAPDDVAAPTVPRQKAPTAPASGKTKKTATPQGDKTAKKTATKKSAAKTATSKAATPKPATSKAATSKTATPKASTPKTATSKASTSKAAPSKAAAPKKSAATAEAPKTAQPTLVELIRRHLTEQSEPRSAAEIATALGKAQPDRSIKTTVVRTSLEGLVAKSQAQRTKQGSSVFYTSPDASDAPKPTASSQTETQPEKAEQTKQAKQAAG